MKSNVLVFPAGEINSIELHEALSNNVNINVFGASSVDRHGPFIFKNYHSGLPFITQDNFINEFNQLIDAWHIDFVFPTHDTVALFLAENSKMIHAVIMGADAQSALICRNKRKTYDLFSEYSFCPEVYSEFSTFPCFIKPTEGQGGVGAKTIKSKEDIPINVNLDDYIISEYLPGEELTVDCITDFHGVLKAVLPRSRDRIMAGVCVSGETKKPIAEITKIAEVINRKLQFLGLWYFQLKKDNTGNYKLLEVSSRCAGTMCLSRARGVNLPLLSVYVAQGKEITVFENDITVKVDRTLISRYNIGYSYETVYIDYDDTVVQGENVCLPVIRFLYQCKNQHKRIVLLTRHETDHKDTVIQSLAAHAISSSLFDQIVILPLTVDKSDAITEKEAVFIDNSYQERLKVHNAKGIPVFDVEGIEVLTDWKS